MNREQLIGRWNEVKGRLQEHWGQLTDDELQQAKGSTDQLVGVVQQRTGATRNEIENFLDQILGSNSITDQVAHTAKQYGDAMQQAAEEAAAQVHDGYKRMRESSLDYSAKAAETVQRRPMESLAIAFGVGLAAGALLFIGNRRS